MRCYCADATRWWAPSARITHTRECLRSHEQAHVEAPFDNPRRFAYGEAIPPVQLPSGTVPTLDGRAYFATGGT